MRKNKYEKTPSRTSPKNSRRGCLCKDQLTYDRKCCDGSLWAQGIGRTGTTSQALLQENTDFLLQENNGKILL
jgi:hypothetical protein